MANAIEAATADAEIDTLRKVRILSLAVSSVIESASSDSVEPGR